MRYNVHIFAVVRVKVPDVEAVSHQDAIKKAVESTDLNEVFDRVSPVPGVEHTEYGEEISHYLVDEVGDEECRRSTFYQDARHLEVISNDKSEGIEVYSEEPEPADLDSGTRAGGYQHERLS
ncbi:MAG: hypothetical protein LAP85_21890 [Acidobacteriia bacterium]|nr:hypothetical protein [Terriglobia bacterium]